MTNRATLLGIGAFFWLIALGCWWRARMLGRDRLGVQAILFVVLGLPFLIAGAFYASSSYPAYQPPPTTPIVASAPEPSVKVTLATPAPVDDPRAHALAVQAAQRAAVKRHPSLGIAGTPLNAAFVAAYQRLQRTDVDYFRDPEWPLHLAEEVARDLAVPESP